MNCESLVSAKVCVRPALKSIKDAQALGAQLISRAQACYDEWDESDIDTYGGGGICHLIAEAMVDVLLEAGIEAQTTDSNFEQHTYVVCRLAEGVYSLDIPFSIYEKGAAYTWAKLPNVTFEVSDLEWTRLDRNPQRYWQYAEGTADD